MSVPGSVGRGDRRAESFRSSYRSDIDGLRGMAVLAVIGFHAFPRAVHGGFVGVDVFFVVSGFLITRIVLGNLEDDRFTFSEFYARRVRRIVPALIVVLAVCLTWGWFVLFEDDYRQLGRQMAGSTAFIANLVFWQDASYFDALADRQPLLHLWSLGIEEQFYLVWPVLLWFAWKQRLSAMWLTIILLGLSFALNMHEIRRDSIATFYSPVTRGWELLCGAALVPLTERIRGSRTGDHRVFRELGSVAGFVLIVISVLMLGAGSPFPGWRAALPTVGTALVIAAGPDALVNRLVLSRSILVGIGLVSYPLYLWHWPLLSFLGIMNSGTPSVGIRVTAIAASGLLAWLTYRFIERPIRFGVPRAAAIPMLCTALAVIAATAATIYVWNGIPGRRVNLSNSARFLQYYDRLRKDGLAVAYWDGCDFMDWKTGQTRSALDGTCVRAGERGTVLLWGDSYAQALSLGIRRGLPSETRLAQVATSACRPSLPETGHAVLLERCMRSNQRAESAIQELRPDVVVLAQMSDHEETDWADLAQRIRRLGGKRVVLVGPSPRWHPSLPLVIASQYWGQDFSRVSYGLDRSVFASDAALKERYGHSPLMTYISLVDQVCNTDGCLAVVPGGNRHDLIAVDAGHLSPEGSVFVVDTVLRDNLLHP